MDTIEETRRKRIQIIRDEFGGYNNLEEITGIKYAQWNQWANASKDHKTGRPRAMSSDIARRIEPLLKKPTGWMDQPVFNDAERVINAIEVLRSTPQQELESIKETFRKEETGDTKPSKKKRENSTDK